MEHRPRGTRKVNMMLDPKKCQALKDRMESLRRKADQKAGALEQVRGQLLSNFGCRNLDEAKILLAKLKKRTEKAEREFDDTLARFEDKWKDKL